MGGSDQWGNIVNGIDLGRRMSRGAVVRADLAADHHERPAPKMGKTVRPAAVVAQRRQGEPVRLLAVLAQYRGRRRRRASSSCSPVLPLDEIAPPSSGAAGLRDQRGQEEGAGNRGDRAGARPRRRRSAASSGGAASPSKKARIARELAHHRGQNGGRGHGRASPCSAAFVRAGLVKTSNSQAHAAAPDQGRRDSRSTTSNYRHRREDDVSRPAATDCTEGVIKLSLGRKQRHVLTADLAENEFGARALSTA